MEGGTRPGPVPLTAAAVAAVLVAAFALLTGGQHAATLGMTAHGQIPVAVDAGAADAVALTTIAPGTVGHVLTMGDAGIPVWRAAAGGSSMDPSVTTYDFASATGVTLTNSSGTAAVTGGVLRLSATTGVDHYTGTWTAPRGSVAIPALSDGRGSMRLRARSRPSITPGAGNPNVLAYLVLVDSGGQRYDVDIDKSGAILCERNDSGPTTYGSVATSGAITTALAGGTLVLEIESVGSAIACRYSTDSGTTWSTIAETAAATARGRWSSVTGTMYTASPGGTTVVTWDDLVVTVWP